MAEPLIKPLPVTVMVKATSPANAALGDMDIAVGTGLLVVPPPPAPPDESDFLQEANNNNAMAKDSSL